MKGLVLAIGVALSLSLTSPPGWAEGTGRASSSRDPSAQGVTAPQAAAAAAPSRDPSPAAPSSVAPEQRAEAELRFFKGLEFYREGSHELALIEFERAYELVPNWRVLYNIGQVSIELRNYSKARQALERYLAEGARDIPPDRATAVEADLKMLRARTAFVRIHTNVEGAEVRVDGKLVGRSPLRSPLILDAGDHEIAVHRPGYTAEAAQLTLAGADEKEVTLRLVKQEMRPAAEPPQVIVQKETIVRDRTSPERPVWLGWTTTGVLAAGAAVTGVLGIAKAGDLKELRAEPGVSQAELDSARKSARGLLVTADVMTAAAVVAGGISWYLSSKKPPKRGGQRRADAAPDRSSRLELNGSGVTWSAPF